MEIKYNNKKIEVPVREVSLFGNFLGLMFRRRDTANLLFCFSRKNLLAIHSNFVFFKFLAVWLDEEDNVLEWKVIRPFSFHISPNQPFSKLVEIPFNSDNQEIIEFFVGKR